MAAKQPKPVTMQVIRRGKTFEYALADDKDWAVLFENTVLEVKAKTGISYYWPLDSVTLWIVK